MDHHEYTLANIAATVGGKLVRGSQSTPVRHLILDSRSIAVFDSSLFVAIRGPHHDGHNYIGEAYLKGVRSFLVDRDISETNADDMSVIQVPDTLEALHSLVSFHRSTFDYDVIGITGSNGKTIVKEWLNQLLAPDRSIIRSPKSYNSQVGVPLSVWNMSASNDLAIIEAGISLPGEMTLLQEIIKPTLGIFTNVLSAHLENFSSQSELALEKASLFKETKEVIFCSDYSEIRDALIQKAPECRHITWSTQPGADFLLTIRDQQANRTVFSLSREQVSSEFTIPFGDSASLENAVHCVVCALKNGLKAEEIAERLSRLQPIAMRLEMLAGIRQNTLVSDVYSSDPDSLRIALQFLDQQSRGVEKVVILGDMEQTGFTPKELHSIISDQLVSHEINYVITIGDQMEGMNLPSQFSYDHYPSVNAFLNSESCKNIVHCDLLIKASRNSQFERVTAGLSAKSHGTVFEIDLRAMQHNLDVFRRQLTSGVKLMVMVKAQSYGSGSHEIANFLEFNQVDYLGVAYADEGVQLRESGISLPIMVMNPDRNSFENLIKFRLEPEVIGLQSLKNLISFIENSPPDYPLPIHIKVDTGMHRLGFEPGDLEELKSLLSSCNKLNVCSVLSHLAASDESEQDEFTQKQVRSFEKFCSSLEESVGHPFTRHILNSSGILRFPEHQFEMVRLGIGMYGFMGFEYQDLFEPAGTLKTFISQIKTVEKGDSVGYSRNFTAHRSTRIATIPVGYADGLFRTAGNGNVSVLLNGTLVPIVGNVCMDMCMLDITDIEASENDEVIIFGQNPRLEDVAKQCSTISYEILTSISSRVKRVYLQE
jgi:alanine racemase